MIASCPERTRLFLKDFTAYVCVLSDEVCLRGGCGAVESDLLIKVLREKERGEEAAFDWTHKSRPW